jgi:CRISPR-associated exonuclease Cas4
MFVSHEFEDNVHTLEGSFGHERVHGGGETHRVELSQFRRVYVYSEKYGIAGIADLVEEKGGEIYPVEYKKGRRGDWKNDELQLCAQALCLEEMLARPIERGYIYYAGTGKRKEVNLVPQLREMTREIIQKARDLMETRANPEAIFGPRCKGCSLYPVCLPRETMKVKKYLAEVRT